MTDRLREVVSKAATPDDIVAAKQQGKRCLYFTGNGVPLTGDAVSVADGLLYVRTLFEMRTLNNKAPQNSAAPRRHFQSPSTTKTHRTYSLETS